MKFERALQIIAQQSLTPKKTFTSHDPRADALRLKA